MQVEVEAEHCTRSANMPDGGPLRDGLVCPCGRWHGEEHAAHCARVSHPNRAARRMAEMAAEIDRLTSERDAALEELAAMREPKAVVVPSKRRVRR